MLFALSMASFNPGIVYFRDDVCFNTRCPLVAQVRICIQVDLVVYLRLGVLSGRLPIPPYLRPRLGCFCRKSKCPRTREIVSASAPAAPTVLVGCDIYSKDLQNPRSE